MSNDRMKEQERRSRKLFIGGVSFSTNDEDFFKYFAKYGELEDCVLIREKDTGQSRGFGFVTYKDKAVSDHVATQQLYLDGRRLDPKPSISRYNMDQIHGASLDKHRNQTTKVFVGGLHDDTAEAEMSEHFGRFGEVLEVNIMYDRFTNAPRGFGFVTFKDADVAHRVINYEQDHIVHGKKVDCKPATARKDAFKKFPDAPTQRVEKPTSREERWRKYHGHEDSQSLHGSHLSSHDPYSRSSHHPHYPSTHPHGSYSRHTNDASHHSSHSSHSSYGRHPSSYPPPPTHHGHPSSYPPPHSAYPPPHSHSSHPSSYPPPNTSNTAPSTSNTSSTGTTSAPHHSSYAHPSYQYPPSSHYPAPSDPSSAPKGASTSSTVPPPYDYSRYDPYASYRQDPRYAAHYPPPPATQSANTTTSATATGTATSNASASTSGATPSTATSTTAPQSTSSAPGANTTAAPGTTAPVYDYSQYQYPSYYQDQTATTAPTTVPPPNTTSTSATAPRYDYYSQYGTRGGSTASTATGSKTTVTAPNKPQTTMPSGYGASRGSAATNSASASRYSAY